MINTEVWYQNGTKVEPGIFRGIQNDKALIQPYLSSGLLRFETTDRGHLWDFEEGQMLELRLKSNIEGDVV